MESLVCVMLLLVVQAAADYPSYEGYKVFKVETFNSEQADFLLSLRSNQNLDFWSPSHIMVQPSEYDNFVSHLRAGKISYEIVIDDVQKNVMEEKRRQEAAGGGLLDFANPNRSYLRYEEIKRYLIHIAKTRPDTARLASIGTTTHGREIPMIMIARNGSREPKHRPLMIIDGGYHGREWLSPSMIIYIIKELTTNPENEELITELEWHIIPVVNPDGYEHSHTQDRFWSRNRGRISCPDKPNENVGVDLNRNFGFHWREYDDPLQTSTLMAASGNPCNQAYAGPKKFSELETRAVRVHMLSNAMRIKLYITFHSCGNAIYYPWGYTTNGVENAVQLQEAGQRANRAQMQLSGIRYKVMAASESLDRPVGTSTDWARGVVKIPLTYSVELPGCGRCEKPCFDPPPATIEVLVASFFPAVRSFALTVMSAKEMLVKGTRSADFRSTASRIGSSNIAATQCFMLVILAFKFRQSFIVL